MKYADNISEVAKLSPDFMGFIFYPKSKRFVGNDFVVPEIPAQIKKVGVFVNDSKENIFSTVKKHSLDFVQLHGDESSEFCKIISEQVKVIKAFGVDEKFDFSVLKQYENCSEYFLFDTKSDEYGGTGNNFDRDLLWNYQLPKPYFLSGGIDLPEIRNPQSAIRKSFALDVNSKFETKPGMKDIHKLKKLFNEVRG